MQNPNLPNMRTNVIDGRIKREVYVNRIERDVHLLDAFMDSPKPRVWIIFGNRKRPSPLLGIYIAPSVSRC